MILHDLQTIFIHVPKTAGNYLTKSCFHRYSRDFITVSGHQDGLNRFGIKGAVTTKKHMALSEYESSIDLKDYYVVAPIRNPVERLVSLYFSPHRGFHEKFRAKLITKLAQIVGIEINVGMSGYRKKPINLEMDEFSRLLNNEMTFKNYLDGYQKCKGLFLIRNDSINNDLNTFFEFVGSHAPTLLDSAVNASRKIITKEQFEDCRELIMKTEHGRDFCFLEELEKAAINKECGDAM